ncbi:MAG: rRNA maturation RNase YbeY [Phycisphaeraceae bacterium]|nr:rRNA maturation RNase YbeY [Phycisphaeraceae bacterium]
MIEVEIHQAFEGIDLDQGAIETLIETICHGYQVADAMVSVAVIDDVETCRLNAQYLNHEGSTDCFSFDLTDETDTRRHFEVIVNGEKALEQARLRGHSDQAELALYVTHGMLHNLGHDDLVENQANKMHAEEDRILDSLGYGIIYHHDLKRDLT